MLCVQVRVEGDMLFHKLAVERVVVFPGVVLIIPASFVRNWNGTSEVVVVEQNKEWVNVMVDGPNLEMTDGAAHAKSRSAFMQGDGSLLSSATNEEATAPSMISEHATEPLSFILQLDLENLACPVNVPALKDALVSPPVAKESTVTPTSKSLELHANVVHTSFVVASEQNKEWSIPRDRWEDSRSFSCSSGYPLSDVPTSSRSSIKGGGSRKLTLFMARISFGVFMSGVKVSFLVAKQLMNEEAPITRSEPSKEKDVASTYFEHVRTDIKKVNKRVYDAQVGCESCNGPHYTNDCLRQEDGKTFEEAYYTQFGVPFLQRGGYRVAALGFYERDNANPLY
nr:hypothetical protein [Tanacetum cinerariifolium]